MVEFRWLQHSSHTFQLLFHRIRIALQIIHRRVNLFFISDALIVNAYPWQIVLTTSYVFLHRLCVQGSWRSKTAGGKWYNFFHNTVSVTHCKHTFCAQSLRGRCSTATLHPRTFCCWIFTFQYYRITVPSKWKGTCTYIGQSNTRHSPINNILTN